MPNDDPDVGLVVITLVIVLFVLLCVCSLCYLWYKYRGMQELAKLPPLTVRHLKCLQESLENHRDFQPRWKYSHDNRTDEHWLYEGFYSIQEKKGGYIHGALHCSGGLLGFASRSMVFASKGRMSDFWPHDTHRFKEHEGAQWLEMSYGKMSYGPQRDGQYEFAYKGKPLRNIASLGFEVSRDLAAVIQQWNWEREAEEARQEYDNSLPEKLQRQLNKLCEERSLEHGNYSNYINSRTSLQGTFRTKVLKISRWGYLVFGSEGAVIYTSLSVHCNLLREILPGVDRRRLVKMREERIFQMSYPKMEIDFHPTAGCTLVYKGMPICVTMPESVGYRLGKVIDAATKHKQETEERRPSHADDEAKQQGLIEGMTPDEYFFKFAADRDYVTRKDFKKMMEKACPGEDVAWTKVFDIDSDEGGVIELEEFLDWWTEKGKFGDFSFEEALDDDIENKGQGGDLQCSVCLDRRRSVIFHPCNHVCACRVCSSQLTSCPQCRATIKSRAKVFL